MKKLLVLMLAMLLVAFTCLAISCDNVESSESSEKIPVYTVTFSQGDGYPNIIKEVEKGSDLTDIPTPKKVAGYDLSWEDKDLTDIQENMTVSIVKTPIRYVINYVTNGGSSEANPSEYTVEEKIIFKNPTKTGYTFGGWYSDRAFTYKVTSISKGTTGTKTFYAKWVPNNNTIIFDANGGSGTMSNMIVATDESANLTPNSFTKPGYTFVGWSSIKNGEVEYKNRSIYTMGVNSTYTLYAVWQINTNGVIFNANGGRGTMSSLGLTTGSIGTLPNNTFTKPGYTFMGWSTTKGGNVVYSDGASYTMGINRTNTLYAVWKANTNTLVFDSNGGSGSMQSMTIATDSAAKLTSNTFAKSGCTFAGWSSTADGEVEYTNGASYTMGAKSSYTLYAVWEFVEYNIFYELNGGNNSSNNPSKYTIEDTIILEAPTNSKYYDFVGWYKDSSFENQITEISNKMENITLYAKWVTNDTALSFTKVNGGYSVTDCVSNIQVVIIPATYNGSPVTSIGESAFSGCTALSRVTIPDSVTSIGGGAFYSCLSLIQINIPSSVISIGGSAFYNCTSLGNITIPDSVTSIGDRAFYNCISLTSVTIPNSLTSIGYFVFAYCSKLTSVTIPNSVTSIDEHAFAYCSKLTSVAIPNGVSSIGNRAFYDCTSLESVNYLGTIEQWCNIEFANEYANPINYGAKLYLNGTLVTELVIPNTVTEIKKYAFYGCTSLTSITIPNSVTTIDDYAFYNCTSITSVTIPDSVTSIGKYAFQGCTSLTSVTIPNSVTSIGGSAFYKCTSLTSVTIGNSVTSIGYDAFYGCSNLTSVTIPNSVTSIGSSAFYNCSKLTSVTIGNSVTSIGYDAFYGCPSLTEINFNATSMNDLYDDADVFYCAGKNGDGITVNIGKNVTKIPAYLFCSYDYYFSDSYSPKITAVVFEQGSVCESIGRSAFYYCSTLTSVVIPDSVTSIGNSAFYGCKSLTIYCEATSAPSGWDSGWNDSGYPVVWDCNNNEVADDGYIYTVIGGIRYGIKDNAATVVEQPRNINEVIVHKSIIYKGVSYLVTSIGDSAFRGCTSLVNITIPDSVTSIGDGAFFGCTSLTNITIPDSVTEIGDWAFRGCTKLTSVTIPDSVTSIGSYAFEDCTSLTSITIGDSVTSIGKHAFYGCKSLTSVTIGNSVTSIGSDAFYGCISLRSVNYLGTIEQWCNVKFDSSYENPLNNGARLYLNGTLATELVIPSTVTEIKIYAFYGCTSLTSVLIGNSVTSIGYGAFYYCTSLTSIEVDENNSSFKSRDGNLYSKDGKTLIQYAPGKTDTSFAIPNSVTSIGERAFYGCTSLTSMTIPNSVTSIGEGAFSGCTSLRSVTIPSSVTSIGDYAFSGCPIENATIPSTAISSIPEAKLKSVVINSGTSIGLSAFSGCTSLTSVTIPNSVTSIGPDAFLNCTSLTSITIPDSVTSISYGAFYYCTSLTSVTIPDSVTSIGWRAFYKCTSLTSVTIPSSVTSIGEYAFSGCTQLTIYCEATEQPSGWDSSWNVSNRPVVWGHTHSYTDGECICGKKGN